MKQARPSKFFHKGTTLNKQQLKIHWARNCWPDEITTEDWHGRRKHVLLSSNSFIFVRFVFDIGTAQDFLKQTVVLKQNG